MYKAWRMEQGRVQGVGRMCRVHETGFRAYGIGDREYGARCRVQEAAGREQNEREQGASCQALGVGRR